MEQYNPKNPDSFKQVELPEEKPTLTLLTIRQDDGNEIKILFNTAGLQPTATLDGIFSLANLDIASSGWAQTCVFSVTDADTIAWAAGTFTSADGTAYPISAGNTGNMSAKTYIYLDTSISKTAYQTTTTARNAVGAGKILIAVAQNGTVEAKFMVMNDNAYNIDAANIVANSITANELSTSLLYAGSLVIDTSGLIRSGQTAYDTGTGFWMGNDAGTIKFSFGNSAGNKVTWDGTTLTIVGAITYNNGTTTRAGDAASGTQNIAHGLGRAPANVKINALFRPTSGGVTAVILSFGFFKSGANASVSSPSVVNIGSTASASNGVEMIYDASNSQKAVITVDATNIILTWTKAGNGLNGSTDNFHMAWEASV